jgi:predicted Zn-dependent protease
MVEFIARSRDWDVRGVVAFITYDKRTYQIVGYSDRTAYGRSAAALMDIIQSFGPVSDPKVLNAEPQHIDIVELDRAMTLEQFAGRYESVIPVNRLAVLNHLSGGDAPIDPGTLVKRVVGLGHISS